MTTALSSVIPKSSSHSWNGQIKSLRNSRRFVSVFRQQSATYVFFAQSIDPNQFVTRSLTALQHDRLSRQFQLLGEKANQRHVLLSFNCRLTMFDLNCVSV